MPAINTSALPGYLKDYFADVAVGFITNHLITDMPFKQWCTTQSDVVDRLVLSEANVANVLQPGGKDAFNPLDNVITLGQRTLYVRDVKVDLRWTPTEQKALVNSYLQYMKRENLTYDKLPFEEWFVPMILNSVKNGIERSLVLNGVYNASGTATADCFDGLHTIAKKNATTGSPNVGIPTANVVASPAGGMTQAVAVAEIEKLLDKVPASDLIARDWALLVDPQVMKLYERDYREEFGTNAWNPGYEKRSPDGAPTVEFISAVGLQGTGEALLFAKPAGEVGGMPGPARFGVDSETRMEEVRIESSERNLKLMIDFKAGIEFASVAQVYQYRKTPAA
jgi:hypothetical protein